ncbi:Hypp5850 [Branchiostoma lanceolatum]|uniref:Hypp5850 protein n=1 Tax=Branchiostoma lanceolatum TaxID=7740 RepID=A0A8J9W4B2_BRALA|nr:Hypp5850 [Branchiostoma lanceolatum]
MRGDTYLFLIMASSAIVRDKVDSTVLGDHRNSNVISHGELRTGTMNKDELDDNINATRTASVPLIVRTVDYLRFCVVNTSCYVDARLPACSCQDFHQDGTCFVENLWKRTKEVTKRKPLMAACLEAPVPNTVNTTGYKLDCHVFGVRDFTFHVDVSLTTWNCTNQCVPATHARRPCLLYVKKGLDIGLTAPPSPIITGFGIAMVGSVIILVLCSCKGGTDHEGYVFDLNESRFTFTTVRGVI